MVEIEEKYPGESWHGYQFRITNNLFLHFPLGSTPYPRAYHADKSWYLALAEERGRADLPHIRTPDGKNSEFWLSKTPRQFSQEFLETVIALGFDVQTFQKKLNQWYFGRVDQPGSEREALDQDVCQTMIKIFMAMREQGYSAYDLRG